MLNALISLLEIPLMLVVAYILWKVVQTAIETLLGRKLDLTNTYEKHL